MIADILAGLLGLALLIGCLLMLWEDLLALWKEIR
jgi:hypothetical protein